MDLNRWLLVGVLALIAAFSVPLILRRVPPNELYGLRTPRTKSNPAVWYPANVFAGWAMTIAAAISTMLVFALPWDAELWLLPVIVLVPALTAVGAAYLYLRRLDETGTLR